MKKVFAFFIPLCLVLLSSPVSAHFGMVIPSQNIVTPANKDLQLTLSFSHPFAGIGMDQAKPARFYVVKDKQETDLLPLLQPVSVMGHAAWQASLKIKRPGVYWYVMEPTPYWEAAEDIFIIHTAKTAVAAFGEDQGWDEPLGLETEIVPLLRPFANYAGNSFSGRVLLKGKTVPGAEVEVEFYNRDSKIVAPSNYHFTQVIKADENGVFTFTCPWPGWWGFAALNEADYTLKAADGTEKEVELGAVLWIYLDPVETR